MQVVQRRNLTSRSRSIGTLCSSLFATSALTAMVAGLSMTAQAAEPSTLTMACKGAVTDMRTPNAKPEPISMGIIVNLTNHTVQGFGFPVRIIDVDEVTVTFAGSETSAAQRDIDGTIDRVTGDVTAYSSAYSAGKVQISTSYDLKCRPAQRMF